MFDPRRTSASKRSRTRWLRSILGKNGGPLTLIPRERRFYDLFEQQAATIVRSAGLLERAFTDVGNLAACQREIKALEHQGDGITHEIVSTLNRTFVTPFDHEDIYALASGLDDILDYIEEVTDTATLYMITSIPEPARELTRLLFAAQTVAAAVIQLATAWGLPVSTTQVVSGSVMGVGATRRFSAVRWGVARRIVWAWVFTIPASAALAALGALLVRAGPLAVTLACLTLGIWLLVMLVRWMRHKRPTTSVGMGDAKSYKRY